MNCEDITRFDLDMDGSFEPSEHGSWVRYEDHVLLLAAQRPVAEPHKQQELSSASVEPVAVYVGETWCGSVVRLYEDLPLETPLYTSSQPADELERERAIELSRAYQEGYARAIQNTTPPYVATPLAAQPAPEQKEDLYELAKQADNWGQP